ncbi:hypothetical protein MASR1M45_16670 [Candidatus Kapaibacterium sp.]
MKVSKSIINLYIYLTLIVIELSFGFGSLIVCEAKTPFFLIKAEIDINHPARDFIIKNYDIQRATDNYIEIISTKEEIELLTKEEIPFKIINDDLEKYFSKRLNSDNSFDVLQSSKYFKPGTMNGYFRLNEIYQNFDSMKSLYPEFIMIDTIGYSLENLPIIVYTIGKLHSDAPESLIMSYSHAREAGTPFSIIYFLWDLFERYETGDDVATTILKDRKTYILPVQNPDGVMFNDTSNPNGGGMWRKNRRGDGNGVYGVDLNRNFGPMESWDAPNGASSLNKNSSTYRGEFPFSEPENIALKNFVESKNINISVNLHSYGNIATHPIGYKEINPSDSVWYRAFLEDNFKNSLYTYDNISQILYPVRGLLDDFLYTGNDKFKPIKSILVEIGSGFYSFWPPYDVMIEYAYKNRKLLENAILSSAKNITVSNKDAIKKDGKFFLKFEIQNIGSNSIQNAKVNIKNDSENLLLVDNLFVIDNINVGEKKELLFEYIPVGIKNGSFELFSVLIDIGYNKEFKENIKLYEYEQIALLDDLNISNWRLDNSWSIFNINNQKCLVTNIDSLYDNQLNSNASYKLSGLSGTINSSTLVFEHSYKIETEYDIGSVWISDSDGNLTNPTIGDYLTPCSNIPLSAQIGEFYGFSGHIPDYKSQMIHFPSNSAINEIAFNFRSDKATQRSGWKIRNLNLRLYKDIDTKVNDLKLPANFTATIKNDELIINSSLNFLNAEILVFNYLGEKIYYSQSNITVGENNFELPGIAQGFYYIICNNHFTTRLMKVIYNY